VQIILPSSLPTMAVPVKFSDIGKSVSDLLKLDFSPLSFELNTQTVNGVKFTTKVEKKDAASQVITGDLKTKYFDAANGITFTYGYNTDRKLSVKAEVVDAVLKGTRVDVESSIKAEKESATKNIKFGFGCKQEYINTNGSIDVLNKDIPAQADLVVGAEGFNVGADVTYNVGSQALATYNLAAGYSQPDYAVALTANPDKNKLDLSNIHASFFHQTNNQLAVGAKLSYNLTSNASTLAVGSAYAIDSTASFKGTFDTNGRIGLQYAQRLRPGVKATFGTNLLWRDASITADTGVSFAFDF